MYAHYFYSTTIGELYIEQTDNNISRLSLINPSVTLVTIGKSFQTRLIYKTYCEIKEYLEGKRTGFDIPISPNGTDFQKKVWKCLEKIPYGKTKSYQDIATLIGNPKACRAVGLANHYNPIMIIIPCHRVIGKNGNMVGYACGLEIKKYLLHLEKNRECL